MTSNPEEELARIKHGIREIAHEINNPLGVLRMAAYLMETTSVDEAKRKHYVGLINSSLDRIEAGLKRLRALRENPPPVLPDVPAPTPEQKP